MTPEIMRRLAAIDMPAEALREVLAIMADAVSTHENRKAKDRERKRNVRGMSAECPQKKVPPAPPMINNSTPPNPLQNILSSSEPEDRGEPKEKKTKRDTAETDNLVSRVLNLYDNLAISAGLPRCRAITDKRKAHILARCRDLVDVFDYPTPDAGFADFFAKVRASPFHCGAGSGRRWKADLDWLINESNMVKILERTDEKTPTNNGNLFSLAAHR